MEINLFINILNEKGVDFFTGVPDSLLGAFCDCLASRYGVNGQNHIVAHNEGGCVALASGYYLASGKIPCVYMQNSGIGNAVNPIASLTHAKVYGLPMLFIIGWRGEPGIKDEPQHIFQGEATLELLKVMGIEYFIIDKNTSAEQVENACGNFAVLFGGGKSAAFVIRKGSFSGVGYLYQNDYKLNREQAIYAVTEAARNDPIVSSTGKISRELFEIRRNRGESHERDFLTVGSMGHSLMIALGIALQKQERRVWCVDGDGAALMHMGSMAIAGNMRPDNLIHIVLNNAAHETVGGMPTVAGGVEFTGIARACGYRYIHKAYNPETLKTVLEQAKNQRGLIFIEILIALGSRPDLGRPTKSTHDNKRDFMRFLSESKTIDETVKGDIWNR